MKLSSKINLEKLTHFTSKWVETAPSTTYDFLKNQRFPESKGSPYFSLRKIEIDQVHIEMQAHSK